MTPRKAKAEQERADAMEAAALTEWRARQDLYPPQAAPEGVAAFPQPAYRRDGIVPLADVMRFGWQEQVYAAEDGPGEERPDSARAALTAHPLLADEQAVHAATVAEAEAAAAASGGEPPARRQAADESPAGAEPEPQAASGAGAQAGSDSNAAEAADEKE